MKKSHYFFLALIVISATSCSLFHPTTMKDKRDGKIYKTVKIGKQKWMAENLSFATPANSWCYDDKTSNGITYGRLYTWEAAKTACPKKWHLPYDAEFTTLTNFLGQKMIAGGKLKAKSRLWNSPNTEATDTSGFSALPGGQRNTKGMYSDVENRGYWWTATDDGTVNAWYRYLSYNDSIVGIASFDKNMGFSVRCMKD